MQMKINALDMARQIRDAHYEQIKNSTHEERLAFYRAKAQKLHAELETLLPAQQETEQSE